MRILVIEDNNAQKTMAQRAVEAAGHYCCVAEDLGQALWLLGLKEEAKELGEPCRPDDRDPVGGWRWDAIITDLHFPPSVDSPDYLRERPTPNGVEIMLLCKERAIPCVVCTDIDHHVADWIIRVAKRLGQKVVADKGPNNPHAWNEAVRLLPTQQT